MSDDPTVPDTREKLQDAWDKMHGRKWIPVGERLPTVETRCLIWELIPNQDMAIEFASWLGDRWKTHGAISSILHPSMVSHWMPLPEPPSAE